MIKLFFEGKENTIDDNFNVIEKDELLEKIVNIVLDSYNVSDGFKSQYLANILKDEYNAYILFVDDLETDENLVY